MARFGQALRALAARAGKPGVYHETITWAYLLLINERLAAGSRDLCFADFAARNSDLFTWKPSILESYYRSDILASDLARRVFVLPGHVNRLENQ